MPNVAISMLFRYDEKYKSHNTNGLNRNIGCIEIQCTGNSLHQGTELNRNIGCIEICGYPFSFVHPDALNRNIGCIEIVIFKIYSFHSKR